MTRISHSSPRAAPSSSVLCIARNCRNLLLVLVTATVGVGIRCPLSAQAQSDPFAPPQSRAYSSPNPFQARYVVETFHLPVPEAQELLMQKLGSKDLHDRALKAVQTGTGVLASVMVLTSRETQRAVLEQINRYPYPTEVDPPQIPQNLAWVDPGAKNIASPQAPVPPATASPPPAERPVVSPFNGGLGILSTTTPTAFEVTSLGEVLGVTAGAAKDDPTLIELESRQLISERLVSDIPIPRFSENKMGGQRRLTDGVPAFLGSRTIAARADEPAGQKSLTSLTFVTQHLQVLPAIPPEEYDGFRKACDTIRTTLEVFSLPKTDAHALLLAAQDDTALHGTLTQRANAGDVIRETALVCRGRPGRRVTIANEDQYVYPTEFDPPQIPQQLLLMNHELQQDLRAGRQTGLGEQPPVPGGTPNGGFGLITTLSPTAFEITPLGDSLTIDAAPLGDDFVVECTARLNRLAGTITYNGIAHPVFEVQGLTSTVQVQPGRPFLVGTLNKPLRTGWKGASRDDRVWLAFLRTSSR